MLHFFPRHPVATSILLLSLAFTFSAAQPAAAQTAQDDVQAALDDLHDWLGQGRKGQGWRRYLKSEQLVAQLSQGGDADEAVVAEIINRYESDKGGLDLPQFVAVKEALHDWAAELEMPKPSELPEAATLAKESFSPITDEHAKAAKAKLEAALEKLNQFLASGGKRKLDGWNKYLETEELQKQVQSEEAPNLAVIQRIEGKYRSDKVGLELAEFTAVRNALSDYLYAAYFTSRPNVEEEYAARLDQLAEALQAYNEQPSGEHASTIGRTIGWLESAGQASELVKNIRHHYQRPNFYAQLSGDLIAAGSNLDVDDTSAVSEYIQGTSISGTARTIGQTTFNLVPNRDGAAFEIRLSGNTWSNTVGYQWPVTVYGNGVTSIYGAKRVVVDQHGVHSSPAWASCATNANINGIDGPPLIRLLAWEIAAGSEADAEWEAARKAEARIAYRMDSQAQEPLEKANEAFLSKFRLPLERRGEFPQMFQLSTTNKYLRLKMAQANGRQIGAPGNPPPLKEEHDMAVRIHESIVSNFTEALVGRETLTGDKLAQLITDLTGKEPEDELKSGEDKPPWSITFAAQRPISVEFNDGTIRFSVRAVQFTSGNDVLDDPMEVSAVYKIERSGAGSKMTRQGDVEVEYLREGKQSLQQISLKAILRRKMDAIFKAETQSDGIQLPGPRYEEMGKLHLQELSSDDGWLVLGWQMPSRIRTARAEEEQPAASE